MSGAEKLEEMMYCAACGIAEVDDIKLKTCTACQLVRYCSVMSIGLDTKKSAKSEWLNYVTKFCSSSLKAATSGTARSVVYRIRLRMENVQCIHVAAKRFVTAVIMPI
jgi:hypothetical protein